MLYPLSHRRQNRKRKTRINTHILLCWDNFLGLVYVLCRHIFFFNLVYVYVEINDKSEFLLFWEITFPRNPIRYCGFLFYPCFTILRLHKCGIEYTRFLTFIWLRKTGMSFLLLVANWFCKTMSLFLRWCQILSELICVCGFWRQILVYTLTVVNFWNLGAVRPHLVISGWLSLTFEMTKSFLSATFCLELGCVPWISAVIS